jgi:hypothetical protein
LCSKKPLKKVAEAHFQKVLIRQKSAQTTIPIKHCILTEKVFIIFWALNGIYYLWGKTKIINSSLYEQKNHFSYPVSVADDGNFSCHCATESRHDLHLPLRSAERYVLCALEWQ